MTSASSAQSNSSNISSSGSSSSIGLSCQVQDTPASTAPPVPPGCEATPAPMQRQADRARSALQHACRLDIYSEPGTATNTALLCTVGPACTDPGLLANMMAAGMAIARLNLSHGSLDEHRRTVGLLRRAEKLAMELDPGCGPLAIAVDTRGPEIRTGLVQGPALAIATGSRIVVSSKQPPGQDAIGACTEGHLWLDFPGFANSVKPGQTVLMDDGLLRLRVAEVRPADLAADCDVEIGGQLGSRRGVCLPGVDTGLPELTPRDLADLAALTDTDGGGGGGGEIDIVMLSFARGAEGVRRAREAATGRGGGGGAERPGPLVVAKICDLAGLRALDEILATADGVLVARGDLGSELRQEKVFVAQKRIIARCRMAGKASICATHLLDSMLSKPRPTRAEASDVANAVMDGADCLMLSGETANGRYPLESVRTLAKICREAEAALHGSLHSVMLKRQLTGPAQPLEGNAMAACEAAGRCHAAAIVVVADHSRLAQLTAQYRPSCPILHACRDAGLCRSLQPWYGVHPLLYTKSRKTDWIEETNGRIKFATTYGRIRGLIKPTDLVVLLVEKCSANSSDLLAVVQADMLLRDTTTEASNSGGQVAGKEEDTVLENGVSIVEA